MTAQSDLEAARAELQAMRERHKEEAEPLTAKINRLKQAVLREAGRTQRKVESLADQIAAGMVVYSRDPAEIAQGATPMWEMRHELRASANAQRIAAGFAPLDFSNPNAVAANEPEHDPQYQELLRLEAEHMARGDG